MARVYYVGDWAVLTGPVFAETPFHYSPKGLDIFNYGHWLKSALEATGEHEVVSVPSWDFYNKLGPGDYERVLAEHDVLVFSDVDAKLFQLAPSFFDRTKFGREPLTYPDRIRLTLEAVRSGKGLMLLGGWYSLHRRAGQGRLGPDPPRRGCCRCAAWRSRTSSRARRATRPSATAAGRAFFRGLDLRTMPPLLGYNRTRRRPGGQVLLEVAETGDPLLAVRRPSERAACSPTRPTPPRTGA